MTVKELMENLQGAAPDAEVLFCNKPISDEVGMPYGGPVTLAMKDDRTLLTVREAQSCEAVVVIAADRSRLFLPTEDGVVETAAEISTTYAKPPAPPLTVASVSVKVKT